MEDETLYLTDTRLEVLNGEYEGGDNVQRTHESNIRQKSRLALSDLTRVARSQYIDTTAAIDPEALAELVRSVMTPDVCHMESGGVAGPVTDPDDPIAVDMTDEFRLYRDDLYFELNSFLEDYPEWRNPPTDRQDNE